MRRDGARTTKRSQHPVHILATYILVPLNHAKFAVIQSLPYIQNLEH